MKACRYCKGTNIDVTSYVGGMKRAECQTCGASGPKIRYDDLDDHKDDCAFRDALRTWNEETADIDGQPCYLKESRP